jgi:hypothetical protein
MKKILTVLALALALAPALALAQQPAVKSTTKSTTKSAAKKSAASKPQLVAKAAPARGSVRKKSSTVKKAAAAVAPSPTAPVELTPEELAVADHVYVGHIACEFGVLVDITADAKSPGNFDVQGKGFKYHMTPVTTTTGAVRLEDQNAGAMWIQVASKSMLMNKKQGQRVADECHSPEQVTAADTLKNNPQPSLFQAPQPAEQPPAQTAPAVQAAPAK